MHTFGPFTAVDPRTSKPLPGRPATVVDAETGEQLATHNLDEMPASVATNARGWAPAFKADARVVLVRIRGGDPIPLVAQEVQAAAASTADLDALREDLVTISTTPPAIGGLWVDPTEEA